MKAVRYLSWLLALAACNWHPKQSDEGVKDTLATEDTFWAKKDTALRLDSLPPVDTIPADATANRDTAIVLLPSREVNTHRVSPDTLVRFARTLMGTRYVYGSTNPKVGFDCSGFITYVFNHFGIAVPRSSIEFTDVGRPVKVDQARQGDLILFTGTNPAERDVGHMGIVLDNSDSLRFIHSSSGKAHGVTVTPLNEYYLTRFVKVIRVFPQNDR